MLNNKITGKMMLIMVIITMNLAMLTIIKVVLEILFISQLTMHLIIHTLDIIVVGLNGDLLTHLVV